MADLNREEFARQVASHAKRWHDAGIEWVPAPDRSRPIPSPSLFELVEPSLPPAEPDRRVQLALLIEEVKQCTACSELASTRRQTVFGVGRMDPEVCFVGEAPGADEDRQGEPFVGAAGQLLTKIIAACGWQREDVYICNILRCRPPGNRTPKPDEAANCRPFLERTLGLIRPRYIVCLGAVAAQNLLQTKASISKLRGRFHDYNGIPVVCTFHPSYLLRSESLEPKRQVWDDMKMLLTRMGKPIPSGKKSSG